MSLFSGARGQYFCNFSHLIFVSLNPGKGGLREIWLVSLNMQVCFHTFPYWSKRYVSFNFLCMFVCLSLRNKFTIPQSSPCAALGPQSVSSIFGTQILVIWCYWLHVALSRFPGFGLKEIHVLKFWSCVNFREGSKKIVKV